MVDRRIETSRGALLTVGTHRIILGGQYKDILWDGEKDSPLRAARGIGFELVAEMLERGAHLKIVERWSLSRHHQRVFVLEIDGYGYYVPFIETTARVFLKTIFPSRKATKLSPKGH